MSDEKKENKGIGLGEIAGGTAVSIGAAGVAGLASIKAADDLYGDALAIRDKLRIERSQLANKLSEEYYQILHKHQDEFFKTEAGKAIREKHPGMLPGNSLELRDGLHKFLESAHPADAEILTNHLSQMENAAAKVEHAVKEAKKIEDVLPGVVNLIKKKPIMAGGAAIGVIAAGVATGALINAWRNSGEPEKANQATQEQKANYRQLQQDLNRQASHGHSR